MAKAIAGWQFLSVGAIATGGNVAIAAWELAGRFWRGAIGGAIAIERWRDWEVRSLFGGHLRELFKWTILGLRLGVMDKFAIGSFAAFYISTCYNLFACSF